MKLEAHSTQRNKIIFRGVAKVVSRQFRVLETVGSSPAASTKKTVFDGLFSFLSKQTRTRTHLAQFTLFALFEQLTFVRTNFERELGSHIPFEDQRACSLGEECGYIQLAENPALLFPY